MIDQLERLRKAIGEIEIQANWPINMPPCAQARMSTILGIIHAIDPPHRLTHCTNCAATMPEESTDFLCNQCSGWLRDRDQKCPHGNDPCDCAACFREADHAFDAAREDR